MEKKEKTSNHSVHKKCNSSSYVHSDVFIEDT